MSDLNILVIDDATFIRDLIKKSLRAQFPNLQLMEAADGKKAISHLKKTTQDLILCDWEMPEINGDEVLKWVRASEIHKDTPFIMVTSRGDKEHLVAAVQAGVSDYLVKPFNNEMLTQKVLKCLKKTGRLTAAHLKPKSSSALNSGFAFDSVNVLTGGAPKATATTLPLTDPSAPKTSSKTAKDNAALGQAQIRFSSGSHSCVIRKISLQELTGIVRRPDTPFPTILEHAVMDIAQPNEVDTVARLNCYIHQLACTEDSLNTRFLTVTVRFIDDDPEKKAFLQRYIDTV